jgi:1-deoxy-D-xylulose-5-phosphate synthase
VAELLAAEGIAMPMLHLGLPDAFQHHGSREQLLAEAGLDAAGIRASLLQRWPQSGQEPAPVIRAG